MLTGINSRFSNAIIIKIVYTHFFVIQTSSQGVNNYVMVDGYVYLWTDVWNNNNSIDSINHAKYIYFNKCNLCHRILLQQIYCENKTNRDREGKNVREMGGKSSCVMSNIYFYLFWSIRILDFHCKCSYIRTHTHSNRYLMHGSAAKHSFAAYEHQVLPKKNDFPMFVVCTKYMFERARFSF